ncbi:MAG: hypothetical protein ABIG28_00580 [archaeon]
MNKLTLSILFLIIGIIIGFSVSKLTTPEAPTITGQAVSNNEYTYTTAICNSENKCIDVLVKCDSGNVVSLTPVSDLLDLGEDFEDFRDERGNFCE